MRCRDFTFFMSSFMPGDHFKRDPRRKLSTKSRQAALEQHCLHSPSSPDGMRLALRRGKGLSCPKPSRARQNLPQLVEKCTTAGRQLIVASTRTSSSSPRSERTRSSVRLMADWLRWMRSAARVTFRSCSRALRGTRRFRSTFRNCTGRICSIPTMLGATT